MVRHAIPTLRPTLEEVRDQFENWRKTRQRRTVIPEPLWQAAVSLSEDYPTLQISKTLRVNHTSLKNRVQASNTDSSARTDSGPASLIHRQKKIKKTSLT